MKKDKSRKAQKNNIKDNIFDINKVPACFDPANDRKTPYTDEEIEMFVNDFIIEFPEHYRQLAKNDGPNTARIILRNRFKARDERRKA